MKILTIFNNKGGVGKTTLTFHLGSILADLGHKVLMVDMDPQCNLTLYGIETDDLEQMWEVEQPFIEDYENQVNSLSIEKRNTINNSTRTIHYLLKPTEQGTADIDKLPPPKRLFNNLDLIPGRLSLHLYEEAISSRWSEVFLGKPLAVKTVTRIRQIIKEYSQQYGYDYVIIDTSPSLGILNKVIMLNADGFIIPALPDIFSLYGIKNIGNALHNWEKEFILMNSLLSNDKKKLLAPQFIKFIGYTLYNARKITKNPPANNLNISQSNYHYAEQIPGTIENYIKRENRINQKSVKPIGNNALIYSHNTLPAMAQKYKRPMWHLPDYDKLDRKKDSTIIGNKESYFETKKMYSQFAKDLLSRIGD